jgi:phosphatidylglycerophosphatase A
LALAVGFALFRFFDVIKPGPVRRMEQIPGADGILLDDVVAGLMALAVLVLLRLTVGEVEIWEWGTMQ